MADPDYDDDELFADLYADEAPAAEAPPPIAPDAEESTELTAKQGDAVAVKTEDYSAGVGAPMNGADTWGEANENGQDGGFVKMERDDSRAGYEDTPIGIKEDG